jgi:hypothetical protein
MASLVTTSLTGNVTITSTFTALNSVRSIRAFTVAGTYTWGNIFKTYWQNNGYFTSGAFYQFWILGNNGVHHYGYRGILSVGFLTGANGYGGETLDWGVSNIADASGPWIGGCGASSFSSIDTTGFTYQVNACGEALNLYTKELRV